MIDMYNQDYVVEAYVKCVVCMSIIDRNSIIEHLNRMHPITITDSDGTKKFVRIISLALPDYRYYEQLLNTMQHKR